MDRGQQSETTQKAPKLSPLAQDKTYGEKKYDLIFGNLINFWLNLILSAGFAFWVKHDARGLFKNGVVKEGQTKDGILGWASGGRETRKDIFTGKEFKNLRELQDHWIDSLSKKGWVRKKGDPKESVRQAESIVNLLTLLTPGHFVMIPSVWLGEKFKAPIVKYFDRKHYGTEAMENPDLKARHDAIAMEEKPTLLGTIVGRAGAALVNVGISRAIGSQENLIKKAGKKYNIKGAKDFDGIDYTADRIGKAAAKGAKEVMGEQINHFDQARMKEGFTYSRAQKNDALDKIALGQTPEYDLTKPYMAGFENLTRYFVQDIMYTFSTAAFMKPIVHGLRHILPGMTYKPKFTPEMNKEQVAQIHLKPSVFAKEMDAPELLLETEAAETKPITRITQAKKESTVTTQPEMAVSTVG